MYLSNTVVETLASIACVLHGWGFFFVCFKKYEPLIK